MTAESIAALDSSLGQAPVLPLPVPLFQGKCHLRGFNQVESIARAALKYLGDGERLQLRSDILLRTLNTHRAGMCPRAALRRRFGESGSRPWHAP